MLLRTKAKRKESAGHFFRAALQILAAAAAADPLLAADPDTAARSSASPASQWSGAYVGAHVGLTNAGTRASVLDQAAIGGAQSFGFVAGGMQAGYNYVTSSLFLIGIEADLTFPDAATPSNRIWNQVTAAGVLTERLDYVGTVRGRIGYAFDRWLAYGTAGLAFANSQISQTAAGAPEDPRSRFRTGWSAGAGVELALSEGWSARLEYLYSRLDGVGVTFPSGARYASNIDLQSVRLGISRQLDWASDGAAGKSKAAASDVGLPNWEFHAQTTFIYQGYPGFQAPYSGANSFTPQGQARETFTASAFFGFRLWEGGELYYNPELLQGFGLSSTVGAGGFPNGEAQKSDFLYPRYNTSRLFVRQTFGLGGEQEDVESEANQLSGKRDISRLTIQVGKFSVKDLFDNNTYSSDPREHFLNWSLWAAGAFDYPADKLGLTYGVAGEFNQKTWTLRTGYFLVPDTANSNNFDPKAFARGGYIAELEMRYAVFSQPGKLRLIGWVNSDFSGSYRDALDLATTMPGLDPTAALVATRQGRVKYGYVVNLEQAVSNTVGLFGRWSWNDGRNEIMAFTDIDASLSGGVSIKGKVWGRPDDTIGVGGAINTLSKDHRDYLAAGGLGILVGDGKLNYRPEQILEAYYAIGLAKALTLTLDYQYMVNPAYNADRGPISFVAVRLHAEL
jgi:high affinity Mn2+ porin